MKWIVRPSVFIAAFVTGLIGFSMAVSNGLRNCDGVVSGDKAFDNYAQLAVQNSGDIREIYTAIINDGRYKDDKVIVIDEMSNRGGTLMDDQIDKGDVPGADKDTIASYKTNNLNRESVRPHLYQLAKVVFWTEADSKATFHEGRDGMKNFYKRFPKSSGILTFSSIGFNAKKDQALVYFSYYCGSLCAGGSFIILTKKDGDWTMSRKNELWVS